MSWSIRVMCVSACGAVLFITMSTGFAAAPKSATPSAAASPRPRVAGAARATGVRVAPAAQQHEAPSKAFLDSYCVTCHNDRMKAGGLVLAALDPAKAGPDAEVWEKVVTKLRAGLMPPVGARRPARAEIDGFVGALERTIDTHAAAHPDPGRTETWHRLNRAEYKNALRDVLALDVDVSSLLPHDETSYGFDNIAGVLRLSPLLMERYLGAAEKVARLALGTAGPASGEIVRLSEQLDQDVRLPGMPIGSRGGARLDYLAPRDGEYSIKARLARGVDYDIPHFLGEQHLEISIDGERVQLFTLAATPAERLNIERQIFAAPGEQAAARTGDSGAEPSGENRAMARRNLDDDWVVTVPLKAGVHEVRATFLSKTQAVPEGYRRPFLRPYFGRGLEDARETREGAALQSLEIMGPERATGASSSESYRKVFVCRPSASLSETACARRVLSTLARRAYRRAITENDLGVLMAFYDEGRSTGSFDDGIELALARILVSPSFLFRTELPPAGVTSGTYRISDVELASRLSFFLWSSVPDEELLQAALSGRLRNPMVLEAQTRRMLADPRSEAFVSNFAGQWLGLRKLVDIKSDPFLFPDFGDALALGFQREAELFFGSILRENRPALELLTADYTFLNERLAQHYGIPQVKGVQFRRVALPANSPRIGLLGKGAVLTVTAFPNRTSPVVRGKWVLQNLLGAPPPEPPPNVPALTENGERVTKVLTMRQRVEMHRQNPICASCHTLMDPIGFALEQFDAIGRYRTVDEHFAPIDSSGAYPDGSRIDGLAGLRAVLVDRGDQFVFNLTSRLMTYALGRGVEADDAPAVRRVLREAGPDGQRLFSLVLGIVKSAPFQMRRVES